MPVSGSTRKGNEHVLTDGSLDMKQADRYQPLINETCPRSDADDGIIKNATRNRALCLA